MVFVVQAFFHTGTAQLLVVIEEVTEQSVKEVRRLTVIPTNNVYILNGPKIVKISFQ